MSVQMIEKEITDRVKELHKKLKKDLTFNEYVQLQALMYRDVNKRYFEEIKKGKE